METSNYEKLRTVIHDSLFETAETLINNISEAFNVPKEDIKIETVNNSMAYVVTVKQPLVDVRINILGDIQ